MFARYFHGVLEIVTSSGSLYIKPSVPERLCLLWIFRNFRHLPLAVLNPRDQKTIESIAFNRKRVSTSDDIIGTVDCRPVGPIGKKPPTPAFVQRTQLRESAEI